MVDRSFRDDPADTHVLGGSRGRRTEKTGTRFREPRERLHVRRLRGADAVRDRGNASINRRDGRLHGQPERSEKDGHVGRARFRRGRRGELGTERVPVGVDHITNRPQAELFIVNRFSKIKSKPFRIENVVDNLKSNCFRK